MTVTPASNDRGKTRGVVATCIITTLGSLCLMTYRSQLNLKSFVLPFETPITPKVVSNVTSTLAVRNQSTEPQFTDYYRSLYQYKPSRPRSNEEEEEALQECGSGPGFEAFFKQNQNRRSSNREDVTIYNSFFKESNTANHTFVELGGFNGLSESNSRFFETCLGWEGLMIEANPRIYPQLVENRPHVHRVSFAASCSLEEAAKNKTIFFHDFPWSNAAQANVNNSYTGHRTVEVFCGSLTPILLDLFQGHVTFFSLDVEGAEPLVVSNIDFDKVFIEVLIAESRNAHCGDDCVTRAQTREIMKQAGYHLYPSIVTKSDLYVHPESEFLKEMDGIASE